tara:strand:- start:24 stop:230 length:207 start_codon:yes stop_codon:yes gene_type:complete
MIKQMEKKMEIKKGDYIKLDTGEVGKVINISSDNEIVDIQLNISSFGPNKKYEEFESVRYSEIQIFNK